jgi:hypothetical protein
MKSTLDQVRCFIAVAEKLHFGRAAERLAMTQPPLSRQIQKLERAVGAGLLDRDNRRNKFHGRDDGVRVGIDSWATHPRVWGRCPTIHARRALEHAQIDFYAHRRTLLT